jgi:hypothetical protein
MSEKYCDEFKKTRDKFRKIHNTLRNKHYAATKAKSHDIALQRMQAMTEENQALGALGYWFDEKANGGEGAWTKRKRTPAERKAHNELIAALTGGEEAELAYWRKKYKRTAARFDPCRRAVTRKPSSVPAGI